MRAWSAHPGFLTSTPDRPTSNNLSNPLTIRPTPWLDVGRSNFPKREFHPLPAPQPLAVDQNHRKVAFDIPEEVPADLKWLESLLQLLQLFETATLALEGDHLTLPLVPSILADLREKRREKREERKKRTKT